MSTSREPISNQTEYDLRGGHAPPGRTLPGRTANLRRVRRMSNWSLAALLVGVGATSAALAGAIPGHTGPALSAGPTQASAAGQTPLASGQAPAVSSPVAATTPSQVVPGSPATGASRGSTRGVSASTGSTWRDS